MRKQRIYVVYAVYILIQIHYANWENIFGYAPISANHVDYPYTVSFRYALMRFEYPHMRLHFPITHGSFMQIRKIQAHIRGYLTPLVIINTIEGVRENYQIIIIIIIIF